MEKYYQYDGTAETAKKIAASIDKGKQHIYDGDEYDIEQEDIDMKNKKQKARKDGDLDIDYYSSPMAKKKWILQKIKKPSENASISNARFNENMQEMKHTKNLKRIVLFIKIFRVN